MKKMISVLLALVLFALPLSAVIACADDVVPEPDKVFYVTIPEREENKYSIHPYQDYSQYVAEGQDFKFIIVTHNNFRIDYGAVYYFNTNFEDNKETGAEYWTAVYPDNNGVYTIPDIHADVTIGVNGATKAGLTGIVTTLVGFLRTLFSFINTTLRHIFGRTGG